MLAKKTRDANLTPSDSEQFLDGIQNCTAVVVCMLHLFVTFMVVNVQTEYLVKLCKLADLHPLFVSIWIRLANTLLAKLEKATRGAQETHLLLENMYACYLIAKEIHKHGYMHRSAVVLQQKIAQKQWVIENACHAHKQSLCLLNAIDNSLRASISG